MCPNIRICQLSLIDALYYHLLFWIVQFVIIQTMNKVSATPFLKDYRLKDSSSHFGRILAASKRQPHRILHAISYKSRIASKTGYVLLATVLLLSDSPNYCYCIRYFYVICFNINMICLFF